jgi:hypothetical protein
VAKQMVVVLVGTVAEMMVAVPSWRWQWRWGGVNCVSKGSLDTGTCSFLPRAIMCPFPLLPRPPRIMCHEEP